MFFFCPAKGRFGHRIDSRPTVVVGGLAGGGPVAYRSRPVTDGGWLLTDGGWQVTDGGWQVAYRGLTDENWWLSDGGWRLTSSPAGAGG